MSEHLLHFLSNVITNQFLSQWSMHMHTQYSHTPHSSVVNVASKVHLSFSFIPGLYCPCFQAVALVCGVKAAPQFNGDSSLARILQEQR